MRPRRRPGWIDIVVCGLLPGLLAGTQTAGLLFYLNPGLPFAAGPVLRAVLLYGSLLGAVGLALHLPFTWGRPQRARRALPWGLTIALALAAALDWTHAAAYAYYLPPGINERLLKAALWLSLAALICFYTALLHTLHRRRYGRRSRWAYVALAVLSTYVMVERREAFRPQPPPARLPPAVEPEPRPRLWVVGIDAATLDAVLPLAGQGRLPFLETVLQQGAYGRLESLRPYRREALWMTLATGKYPYKHGTVGSLAYRAPFADWRPELRLLPRGLSFRSWGTFGRGPVRDFAPRQALALWEILPRAGVPTGLVGWPASSPLGPDTAFGVSERFFTTAGEPGGVRPDGIAPHAYLFRPETGDLALAAAARFGPEPPPEVLAALAADLWRSSLALELLDRHQEVEATFLALPGLLEVSRRWFGGFSAVEFAGDEDVVAQRQADLLAAYYGQLDELLAGLWRREAGRPRLLALVSPYGIEAPSNWDRLKREIKGDAPPGASFARSPDGVLALYGDGVRPRALLTGARLADVVPTLLYGLGFPVARDFDGRVLTQAFDRGFLARHPMTFLPSYEALVPERDRGSR